MKKTFSEVQKKFERSATYTAITTIFKVNCYAIKVFKNIKFNNKLHSKA